MLMSDFFCLSGTSKADLCWARTTSGISEWRYSLERLRHPTDSSWPPSGEQHVGSCLAGSNSVCHDCWGAAVILDQPPLTATCLSWLMTMFFESFVSSVMLRLIDSKWWLPWMALWLWPYSLLCKRCKKIRCRVSVSFSQCHLLCAVNQCCQWLWQWQQC